MFNFLRTLHTVLHLHQFTFPPTVQEGSLSSTSSPTLVVFSLLDNGHSDRYGVIAHCDPDLCFPSDVGHLLIYLLAIYLLWNNIYSDLLPRFFVCLFSAQFLVRLLVFFGVFCCCCCCLLLSCMSPLYILDINDLSDTWFANIFSCFERRLPFHFVDSFLYYAEAFSLVQSHLFILLLVLD